MPSWCQDEAIDKLRSQLMDLFGSRIATRWITAISSSSFGDVLDTLPLRPSGDAISLICNLILYSLKTHDCNVILQSIEMIAYSVDLNSDDEFCANEARAIYEQMSDDERLGVLLWLEFVLEIPGIGASKPDVSAIALAWRISAGVATR